MKLAEKIKQKIKVNVIEFLNIIYKDYKKEKIDELNTELRLKKSEIIEEYCKKEEHEIKIKEMKIRQLEQQIEIKEYNYVLLEEKYKKAVKDIIDLEYKLDIKQTST